MNTTLIRPALVLFSMICLLWVRADAQDLQADNMLLFQRSSGGWFKQFKAKSFSYNREFTPIEKRDIADEVKEGAATIDNGATCKEIRYLVKAYKEVNNPRYLVAAEKGIRYLLSAQYANGGFPQYYPNRGLYRNEITYNDNAMINALNVLQDVALKQNDFDVVDAELSPVCAAAVAKGIDCILKTQIRVDGKLTGWCQQYNEITLQPAKARAYELPSISGCESVAITEFLIAQRNPTREIKDAVSAAVIWLEQVKIEGFKIERTPPNSVGKTDRQLVADAAAPPMWARYYEIGSNKPFFCDRDGLVRYSIAEIGFERRNGYSWYGNWPKELLEKSYPRWVQNLAKQ